MVSPKLLPGFGKLNVDPRIVHCYWYTGDIFAELLDASRDLPKVPVIFLVSSAWSALDRWRSGSFAAMSATARIFHTQFPRNRVILLGNDHVETGFLRQLGYDAATFNHNAFSNFWRYRGRTLREAQEAEWDSVYIARIEPYKRIELMEKLNNSVLIFGAANKDYYEKIKNKITNVKFANGEPFSPQYRILTGLETNETLKTAKVGLCLSAVEGAMLSSTEYLVAGLPVVSTYSIGGRDAFFTAENSLLCEDTPFAVAAAVQEAINRDFDPVAIHTAAVLHIMKSRAELLEYIFQNYNHRSGSDFELLSAALLNPTFEFAFSRWSISI